MHHDHISGIAYVTGLALCCVINHGVPKQNSLTNNVTVAPTKKIHTLLWLFIAHGMVC